MPKRYREYTLALGLLVGCGLLLAALLAEWAYYRSQQAGLKARLAEAVEVHLKTPTLEQKRYELPGLENYSATVERPLFMETRRPAEEEASQPATAVVEKTPLNLKLKGIASDAGQAVGLFVDAKGKYKRLHKNESMDGWKVAELQSVKAIMEQNGAREELRLFEPKPRKKPQPQGPGVPVGGQIPGQPGQPPGFPPQPAPFPGAMTPDFPQPPTEPEQANPDVPVDQSAVPPEEPANDQ